MAAMSWRDGCHPRPVVTYGATAVQFDFDAADAAGAALARVSDAMPSNISARVAATSALTDWKGAYRERYDTNRATQEAILLRPGVTGAIGALRAAWDAAAEAQVTANAKVPPTAPGGQRPR